MRKFTFVKIADEFTRAYFKCVETGYTFIMMKSESALMLDYKIVGSVYDPYLQSPMALCIKDFDLKGYKKYPKI